MTKSSSFSRNDS